MDTRGLDPGKVHEVRVFLEDILGYRCATWWFGAAVASNGTFAEATLRFRIGGCLDADGDGFSALDPEACPGGDDCDDADNATHPGAPEVCDGADNDCDGQVDEDIVHIEAFGGAAATIHPRTGGRIELSGTVSAPAGEPVAWRILFPDGQVASGNGTTVQAAWLGRDAGGKALEAGRDYPVTLEAQVPGGCGDTKTITLHVADDGHGCLRVTFGSTANIATGNLRHRQVLVSLPGEGPAASLTLTYNSLEGRSGPLGPGWTHTHAARLLANANGSYTFVSGAGDRRVFYPDGAEWRPEGEAWPVLSREADGRLVLRGRDATARVFDAGGRPLSVSDRNGNTLAYTYDAEGRLSAVTDPSGTTHAFSYEEGRLVRVASTAPDGTVSAWTYAYDASGLLLEKTDPAGHATHYAYDAAGRVIESTDAEGRTRRLSYLEGEAAARVTEPGGGAWTYRYDPVLGVVTERTDPEGRTTAYTYDAAGRLVAVTDPAGAVTRYAYDARGNRTSVTDPAGRTTVFTYDAGDRVASVTDPEGRTTRYTYDERGNLSSVADPAGGVTRIDRDERGDPARIEDPTGRVATLTYDAAGRLVAVADALGGATRFAYDAAGRLVRQEDPEGGVTEFAYDTFGRLVRVTDPLGHAATYTYDALGRLLSATDADGRTTRFEVDAVGRTTAVTDALGGVTRITY
ncbi:DUF6531 domain-containing protein, partial [Dissulfurirhabdus thermomarina]